MIDDTDRRIIAATQGGLPLVPQPYAEVAKWLGLTAHDVTQRLSNMIDTGVIRRIAIAPNHYALGMTANGMSVWDVTDEDANGLGETIGQLPFVDEDGRLPFAHGQLGTVFDRVALTLEAPDHRVAGVIDPVDDVDELAFEEIEDTHKILPEIIVR